MVVHGACNVKLVVYRGKINTKKKKKKNQIKSNQFFFTKINTAIKKSFFFFFNESIQELLQIYAKYMFQN
jgi:hypothetical protein